MNMQDLNWTHFTTLFGVVLIDITLAVDNVVVIGSIAARLPESIRKNTILVGTGAAFLFRVLFAFFALHLLKNVGLTFAGGLLLLWVAWKLWRDLHPSANNVTSLSQFNDIAKKTSRQAILQIILADLSMSLDNTLAVAGTARNHFWIMVLGLSLSVCLMGLMANFLARFIQRHAWISYLGFLIVLYVAVMMIWDGARGFVAVASANATDWKTYAIRLTGEADSVTQRAISKLTELPQLELSLRRALNTRDSPLALDVISRLNLKDLYPDLIKFSETDTSGFSYNTLTALVGKEDFTNLMSLYKKRVRSKNISIAAKVILIDTFARLCVLLPINDVRAFLLDASDEVRSAGLSYIRDIMFNDRNRATYFPLVMNFTESPGNSYQLMAQAYVITSEVTHNKLIIPIFHPKSVRPITKTMSHNPDLKVRVSDDDSSCYDPYRNLYSSGSVNIHIAFGYKDASPARFVGDRYERGILVQKIIAPCADNPDLKVWMSDDWFACGFRRSALDSDLFTKTIKGPSGLPVTVKLIITHSSVGTDDLRNRTNPLQKWQSHYARSAFATALQTSDIVFYNGHSRSGGGPDFEPPRFKPTISFRGGTRHVDYAWYQANRPGLKFLIKHLKTPKLIGLFSCSSEKLFSDAIRLKKQDIGIISSAKLTYYSDALTSTLNALSSILSMRCKDTFTVALRGPTDRQGLRLSGFFK